jgi:hypothetical protein
MAATTDGAQVTERRVCCTLDVSRFVLTGRDLADDVNLPLQVLSLAAVVAPEVPASSVALVERSRDALAGKRRVSYADDLRVR